MCTYVCTQQKSRLKYARHFQTGQWQKSITSVVSVWTCIPNDTRMWHLSHSIRGWVRMLVCHFTVHNLPNLHAEHLVWSNASSDQNAWQVSSDHLSGSHWRPGVITNGWPTMFYRMHRQRVAGAWGAYPPPIFMNNLFQTRAKTMTEATVSTSTAKSYLHIHKCTVRTPCPVTALLCSINLESLTYQLKFIPNELTSFWCIQVQSLCNCY